MLDNVLLVFEESGGLDALETLQLNESQEVYEMANKILLTHFEEDLSQLGSLQALLTPEQK